MNYCLCGCGQLVKNKFVRFHHWRGKFSPAIGRKKSIEELKKLSQSKLGELNPAKRLEVKLIISQKAKARFSNPDFRKKISDIRKKWAGEKNPFYGKHHTDISKKKIGKRYYPLGIEHHWFNPNRRRNYPLVWRDSLKRAIRERDNYKCQMCGVPQEEYMRNLDVHHIDRDKYNCDPKNLISLCATCHSQLEHNKTISPVKTAETAGNPERAICNEAPQGERSETIMVALLKSDDGIVRTCEESQKNNVMATTLLLKEERL